MPTPAPIRRCRRLTAVHSPELAGVLVSTVSLSDLQACFGMVSPCGRRGQDSQGTRRGGSRRSFRCCQAPVPPPHPRLRPPLLPHHPALPLSLSLRAATEKACIKLGVGELLQGLQACGFRHAFASASNGRVCSPRVPTPTPYHPTSPAGLTILKRLCRKFGIARWPYRALLKVCAGLNGLY